MIADDDHLLGPLLRGESAGGSGAYNSYDLWSTSLRRGDAGSTGARLVTVHEALHASLNDTTAFGILLARPQSLRARSAHGRRRRQRLSVNAVGRVS